MGTFSDIQQISSRLTRSIAILLCAAAGLFAQTGSGTITGRLVDPSGAVVPGGTVVILNTNTGVARTTTTNDAGIYVAAFLQPDIYTVTASKGGFGTEERKNLILEVGRTMTIDFAMAVQKASVSSSSPSIRRSSN